jgi:CubicO group peptidase (beta-lactamase class C family)
MIEGRVEPGYQEVADAFAANFERHGDVGAACCVYVGGRPVVDVWGGDYREDTLQLVFSTTKGAAAVCAHLLASRGELDLDAPVASYWPEFADAGKEAMPVRWLLSHRAGLPVIDGVLTRDEVLAVTPVVEALAAQKPVWEPGSAHGYHALTYGWLVGEVVRRATGRTIGEFFSTEVAAPLGLEFWIGLPEEQEPRVSPLRSAPRPTDPELVKLIESFIGPDTLAGRALSLNGALTDDDVASVFNSRGVHATEMPAANGITNARSLARMYAATVGEVDGVRVLPPATVVDASKEQSFGPDRVLQVETRFGSGFMLDSTFTPLLSEASFGHAGAGGSLGFADAAAGVGFGYVMNQMGGGLTGDPRTVTLIEALRRCLA